MISLETSHLKWASSRLEGKTSWIFWSCGRWSRLTTGTSGTRSGCLRKGQSPCELLRGLSGFLSRRCRGLDLVWSRCRILGFLSSVDMDLGGLLDSPQGSQSSSRVGACTCSFLPSCISSVRLPFTCIKGSVSFPRVFPTRLSHEAFPQGFPTRLSHRSVTRATVVSVYPRLESRGSEGKTDFPEWTEISGGLWEWWHNPGVPLAFPVESASS